MGHTAADQERVNLRVGWRNEGNWEALPEQVWDLSATRSLDLADIPFYLWLRRRWRRGYETMAFPRWLPGKHLGLSEGDVRGSERRLSAADLLRSEGKSGRNSPGTTYRLCSLHHRGPDNEPLPLDKHDLRRGGGGWDMVHHGFFHVINGGWIVDERVARVRRLFVADQGPALTAQAGGLFLYFLHLANTGPADVPYGWVSTTWRSINAALGINLANYKEELELLRRLGWLRKESTPRGETNFTVSEAPAGLVEAIALAGAAGQQGIEHIQYVEDVLYFMATREWELANLLDLVAEQGWALTEEGVDFLRAEVGKLQVSPDCRAASRGQLQPRDEYEQDVSDRLTKLGLAHLGIEQVDKYGWSRVRDVVYEAERQGQSLRKPSGWVLAILERGSPVPPAPARIHQAEYREGGKWAHLFTRNSENPEDEDPEVVAVAAESSEQ